MLRSTILIPSFNRPNELARGLSFLDLLKNEFPVIVADGSEPAISRKNGQTCSRYPNVRFKSYPSSLHMGIRCADALRSVETPYVALCADDDFVAPSGVKKAQAFLDSNSDFSVALGRVFSLTYLPNRRGVKYGLLVDDPLNVVGNMSHPNFLQRAF